MILQTPEISGIQGSEILDTQFLQTISKVTFQKWYAVIKLVVNDFSINIIAPIDSRAYQNCIKEELFLQNIVKGPKSIWLVPMENHSLSDTSLIEATFKTMTTVSKMFFS